ncbi:MAG: hypothetical protein ACJAZ1_002182 [Yoonia sp.]|jgi:hypothetical protein
MTSANGLPPRETVAGPDDLGAAVKVLERVCFRHQRRLQNRQSASRIFVLTKPLALPPSTDFALPEPSADLLIAQCHGHVNIVA